MGGSIFTAMVQPGKTDPVWKAWSDYLLRRVPEEFFNLRTDPHCLNNLIGDPKHAKRTAAHLKTSENPMAEVFDTYLSTRSVEKLVATYAAMWPNHNIPGSIAAIPVNRLKWEDPEGAKQEKRAQKRGGK